MSQLTVDITCPSCWEVFSVPAPALSEVPTCWDYDCEVCCRPLIIDFYQEDDDVVANTRSLDDA